MIEVLAFRCGHMVEIVEQEAQTYLKPHIQMEDFQKLENSLWAFTVKSNGRVVACGGVVEYWKGRGEAWAILDRDCKKAFYAIHKVALRMLKIVPMKRIEAHVDYKFQNGHRWAQALGFEVEAPVLKSYMPNGGDSTLYVRLS